MSERDRQYLRVQLASVGIFLPDIEPPAALAPPPAPAGAPAIDRDFIRKALVRAGAPAKDLEWLVASCPSELDALSYRAPLPEAWCVVCSNPQPTDEHGCVRCRSVDFLLDFEDSHAPVVR